MPILHYALKPSGLLWLGASETTGPFRELFEVEDAKHRFYLKKPQATRVPVPLLLAGPRGERPAPVELLPVSQGRRGEDVQREADRILLARFTPPGVLITDELEILQFRGDTGAYLAPASGRASLNLLKMLREGLLLAVRGGIARARRESRPVRKTGVRMKTSAGARLVDVEVVPVGASAPGRAGFLVLFHDDKREPAPAPGRSDSDTEREAQRLKDELESTK